MPQSAQSHRVKRARRARLAGSVLVLIRLENGRQVTAKLHQLSVTGGLVHLTKPLDEAIKVEVIFHVGTTVRSKASMLFPMWATQGYLQPFQFIDISNEDRHKLEENLGKLLQPADVSKL